MAVGSVGSGGRLEQAADKYDLTIAFPGLVVFTISVTVSVSFFSSTAVLDSVSSEFILCQT